MNRLSALKKDLRASATAERAKASLWYFKTGPGEYGEHDKFLGLTMTDLRDTARKYRDLSLVDCAKLFDSPWHEERQAALIIVAMQFKRGDKTLRDEIKRLYDRKMDRINNWDLVDLSAPRIYGMWFRLNEKNPMPTFRRLSRSKNLWFRRIAIISTFAYIDCGSFSETLDIADRLLADKHDLIHKAVGWALREVGKKDRAIEESFLKSRYKKMPRTMLRYAIEKFPEPLRKAYLRGTKR